MVRLSSTANHLMSSFRGVSGRGEVRQGGVPADIVTVDYGVAGEEIRIPQMLHALGTASTRSEAERLVKAGAFEIDGVRRTDLKWPATAGPHTYRLGKKWQKIIVKE